MQGLQKLSGRFTLLWNTRISVCIRFWFNDQGWFCDLLSSPEKALESDLRRMPPKEPKGRDEIKDLFAPLGRVWNNIPFLFACRLWLVILHPKRDQKSWQNDLQTPLQNRWLECPLQDGRNCAGSALPRRTQLPSVPRRYLISGSGKCKSSGRGFAHSTNERYGAASTLSFDDQVKLPPCCLQVAADC